MDRDILRILDANCNRAVEGLRVLEEAARMIRNDYGLAAELKDIRHALSGLVRKDPVLEAGMIRARDAAGDVFREGETESEKSRPDLFSLVRANAGRAEEAVRVLEEYGKLVSGGISAECKRIRFRIYDAEKRLVETFEETDAGIQSRKGTKGKTERRKDAGTKEIP